MLTNLDIAHRRLDHQNISEPELYKPYDVVNELGAVQAQDYLGALWALGLRIQNSTDAVIERAFAEGTILRTHVLRPTWHFVTPADIRWMLELTAPRVKAKIVHMNRRLGLDSAVLLRANTVIANALEGGRQRTRAELSAALRKHRIVA